MLMVLGAEMTMATRDSKERSIVRDLQPEVTQLTTQIKQLQSVSSKLG
jgi:uncharacterized protein YlxW (UPF0749 family)